MKSADEPSLLVGNAANALLLLDEAAAAAAVAVDD
jgi:hypothetical protein